MAADVGIYFLICCLHLIAELVHCVRFRQRASLLQHRLQLNGRLFVESSGSCFLFGYINPAYSLLEHSHLLRWNWLSSKLGVFALRILNNLIKLLLGTGLFEIIVDFLVVNVWAILPLLL